MLPLLTSAYLAPIQWYAKLFHSNGCWIEQHDHFQKQTYRNRCIIATANGAQALTIPIERPSGEQASRMAMKDIRISDHGNWRHIHWQAIVSAYNDSPFFEYYADDFLPFFQPGANTHHLHASRHQTQHPSHAFVCANGLAIGLGGNASA